MEYQVYQDFMIRTCTLDDAHSIVSLFNRAYGESSHPCSDPDYVRTSLQRDIWYVAVAGQEVISCTAGVWRDWHRLYERGRSVTHPDFRKHGLGRRLMDAVLDAIWSRPEGDLVIGYPRNEAMTSLVLQETNPPFVLLGHDGGMNIARGKREYHLLGMSVNPHRQPLRMLPSGPTCYSSAFINGQLLPRLPFRIESGLYPDVDIVGPAATRRAHARSWSIGYHYEPEGQSLHIADLDGPTDDPGLRLDALAACLEETPEAAHRCAYVLYDKTEFILGMQALGFQVSAFLPGWFYAEGARYDCVMLTQCLSEEAPVARGTQEFINLFDSSFNYQTAAA